MRMQRQPILHEPPASPGILATGEVSWSPAPWGLHPDFTAFLPTCLPRYLGLDPRRRLVGDLHKRSKAGASTYEIARPSDYASLHVKNTWATM